MGGLASGEGLVAALLKQPHLLIYEPDFSRVLAVAGREGSTLTAMLRQAYEDSKLRVMTCKQSLLGARCRVQRRGQQPNG